MTHKSRWHYNHLPSYFFLSCRWGSQNRWIWLIPLGGNWHDALENWILKRDPAHFSLASWLCWWQFPGRNVTESLKEYKRKVIELCPRVKATQLNDSAEGWWTASFDSNPSYKACFLSSLICSCHSISQLRFHMFTLELIKYLSGSLCLLFQTFPPDFTLSSSSYSVIKRHSPSPITIPLTLFSLLPFISAIILCGREKKIDKSFSFFPSPWNWKDWGQEKG